MKRKIVFAAIVVAVSLGIFTTLERVQEESHIRCRLELLREDRAFHRFGNGGMGTRMCVLVAPSDYAAAKKLLPQI